MRTRAVQADRAPRSISGVGVGVAVLPKAVARPKYWLAEGTWRSRLKIFNREITAR
jgi:hypothetical protein